jgi:outer membrane receptor for ferrienterochelin and colicins
VTSAVRLAVLAVVLAGRAAADPAVDVADLPPLPPEDAPASAATMLAAASAAEEVVVGAAKREQSLGNVASAVTVISGDRIRRFGYRTIGEAVAGVAGAYLVDNRLSYSIGIRGLQIPGDFNTRLLVLVDGATVNEAWGGLAGLGYDAIVSIEDIARIEVIRGPVSSLYGTNAFFGIINIITRGAAEAPRAWARTGLHTVNGVTTGAGFSAGGVHRQVRGSVHLMDRFGDTTTLEQLPGLELSGDAARAISAGLTAAYDGTFAQVRAFRYTRQSPFAPYDVDPRGRPYEKRDTQLLIEGGHTRELERLTLAGRIYGNFYRFDDSAPAYDGAEAPLDTEGTALVLGAELRGRYEVVAPNRVGVTAGAEASHDRTLSIAYRQDAPSAPFADERFVFDVEGVYTELDAQPTDWLGLTAGLRYDRNSAFENRLSPRLALFIAEPDRYGVKLLYAEGFRAASAFESHFEDGFDYAAHPDIEPEVIRSVEAVAWARPRAGLALRLSGFSWDARQVIEQLPYVDGSGAELLRFENDARYASHGVEAEASYRDSRGWYAFGGVAYTRVGAERAGEPFAYGNVPNAPALTASAGVSTPRLLDRVHVSSELLAIGERPTRSAQDMPAPASPAWLGWNAALHAPGLGGFDVTAGVRNLLGTRDLLPAPADYDRTQPMSILVHRVPAEGRELYVKVGYSY